MCDISGSALKRLYEQFSKIKTVTKVVYNNSDCELQVGDIVYIDEVTGTENDNTPDNCKQLFDSVKKCYEVKK